ncbi:hypothetical protein GMDG_07324 [Pseudogymnoascus destructans 20631-21]|uniref:Uncharacterized protein n=2 Tax=Pseudogymnoascus destructans TaxID=655981 RepID=L8G023_PSED2|nr:hypothetical protein GMDG_07324 [Pseudogymnoascus destructans 20631-21]
MSRNQSSQSRHGIGNTELRLNSLGIATNSAGDLVYLADREIPLPLDELAEAMMAVHYPGCMPLYTGHARDHQATPTRPPGLPSPRRRNSQLLLSIPQGLGDNHQQHTAAQEAAPTVSVTSPAPTSTPVAALAADAAVSEAKGRTSRGVFVRLGGYFTTDQLRDSELIFPPQTMQGKPMVAQGPSSAGAANTLPSATLPSAAPQGSVFYIPQAPAATAAAFVPRATAAPFVPAFSAASRSLTSTAPAAAAMSSSLAVVRPSTPQTAVPMPASSGAPDTGKLRITVKLPQASSGAAPQPVPGTLVVASDLRVVILMGVPPLTSLKQVSDSISSGLFGAVFAITFGNQDGKRLASIVFRDAVAVDTHPGATPGAAGYLRAMRAAILQPWADRDRILWPFPDGWSIDIQVHPREACDLIRAMRPDRERGTPAISRRLSMVGPSGLFNEFRYHDILRVVQARGKILGARVQHLFIYNGGNATMIFADVESAQKALCHLEEHNSQYPKEKRVTVTHSKCPGEVLVQFEKDRAYITHLKNNPRK